jgi:uncharacterized protein (TIGR02147 family)
MKTPSQSTPADFRLFLQEEFLRRCRKNPRYSIRSYALALQTDFSTLAKMLKASRPIGPQTIRRMSARLGLTQAQTDSFVQNRRQQKKLARKSARIAASNPGDGEQSASALRDYQQIALDSFQIISDWYHYAILELMRVEGFTPNARWIASQLGLKPSEATIAIERLIRVGLIEPKPEGGWRDTSNGSSTTLGGPDSAAAFRNLQRQILEKALAALDEIPVAFRDQTSMTMAIDSSKLPEARERAKKFRRELDQLLSGEGARCDAVYHLSLSLYPVTPVSKLPVKEGVPS